MGTRSAQIAASDPSGWEAYWSGWKPGDPASADFAESDAFRGYLEDRSTAISAMTDTRIAQLAQVIADGLAAGSSTDEVAAGLAAILGDSAAAEVVARTETLYAVSQAALARYAEEGVRRVDWLVSPSDACEACMDNGTAGSVPRGETFPSGSISPPEHPNCRCALMPAETASGFDLTEGLPNQAVPDDEGES